MWRSPASGAGRGSARDAGTRSPRRSPNVTGRGVPRSRPGSAALLRLRLPRREVERGGVDAVPRAGRARAVREEVAEMRSAVPADDLGPAHPVRNVLARPHPPALDDVIEARPPRARLELRRRVEQRLVTEHPPIGAVAV